MGDILRGKCMNYPKKNLHWIGNKETEGKSRDIIPKINPATGEQLSSIVRGTSTDVDTAVTSAVESFSGWSTTSVIQRANILRRATMLIDQKKDEIAEIVHLETGKSLKDAIAETEGAIELGFFMAGEGRRYYGKTTTSAMDHRTAMTIRQSVGACALIIPFNTPIANVAWKAFPALLCGNTVVVKASKDTPYTPVWIGKILMEAGLPPGVFSVLQGSGEDVGESLIQHPKIDLISFTGSTDVGKHIQEVVAQRLVRVSLELGGKNAFVVCDDADLEAAADWAVKSAFSNAGQRCASGSRLIVFAKVYEQFKKLLLDRIKKLAIGSGDGDELGPVINDKQLMKLIDAINEAKQAGATVLAGGKRMTGEGYFLEPTILEGLPMSHAVSRCEYFGPLTNLYKVNTFEEAVQMVNDSDYGLTAAIHTANIHRTQEFISRARVGVVSVNGPTYGSEPHLPFGGLKQSGNGHREPGTEALDVYSEWKTVYVKHDPKRV